MKCTVLRILILTFSLVETNSIYWINRLFSSQQWINIGYTHEPRTRAERQYWFESWNYLCNFILGVWMKIMSNSKGVCKHNDTFRSPLQRNGKDRMCLYRNRNTSVWGEKCIWSPEVEHNVSLLTTKIPHVASAWLQS